MDGRKSQSKASCAVSCTASVGLLRRIQLFLHWQAVQCSKTSAGFVCKSDNSIPEPLSHDLLVNTWQQKGNTRVRKLFSRMADLESELARFEAEIRASSEASASLLPPPPQSSASHPAGAHALELLHVWHQYWQEIRYTLCCLSGSHVLPIGSFVTPST